jgi:putative ABC transport system permease protein
MRIKVDHLGALTRAVRNVSRRKMRALLVVIALGFSMAIMISIPPGIVANQEAVQSITANFNRLVNISTTLIEVSNSSGMPSGMPSGATFFRFGGRGAFIDETVADDISLIGGVKDVVPSLEVSSNVTIPETRSTPRGSFTINRPLYTIEGVCLNSTFIEDYSILPTNITAGNNLQEGDSGKVLLSLNLSDYYDVGVNGSISIYGKPFKVVGIYEPALSQGFMTANEVYMNISDAQRITGNTGNVSRLDVYADSASDVDTIAADIQATYPTLSATTEADLMQTYQTELSNAEATVSQTQTVAFEEIVIAIVATSLIVLVMMLYSVRERTKEIGILKAIGFSNWSVMSQFMLEGILISLMAGVVGLVIGIVGAPYISPLLLSSASHINLFSRPGGFGGFGGQAINFSARATVAPDLRTLLLGLGAVVLLGAIGSLYPAWRASRTSPMEALRYE